MARSETEIRDKTSWVRDRLIPDLLATGWVATAEVFEELCEIIDQLQEELHECQAVRLASNQ